MESYCFLSGGLGALRGWRSAGLTYENPTPCPEPQRCADESDRKQGTGDGRQGAGTVPPGSAVSQAGVGGSWWFRRGVCARGVGGGRIWESTPPH